MDRKAKMNFTKASRILVEAAALPIGNQNGMKISMPGVLSHAHRSLTEMSQSFENAPEHIVEQFDDRLMESQPLMRAHGLEELGKHLKLLQEAFNTGDAQTVRQFFDLYVFD
jgi:hypothetical protein